VSLLVNSEDDQDQDQDQEATTSEAKKGKEKEKVVAIPKSRWRWTEEEAKRLWDLRKGKTQWPTILAQFPGKTLASLQKKYQ